jgi:hypothetical protein
METIKDIFNRTRLCEGLRIPRTVVIANYNRSDYEAAFIGKVATFLERSGVQNLVMRYNHNCFINPFMKVMCADLSVSRGLTVLPDFIKNEEPEVAIWSGEDSRGDNVERFYTPLKDRELLNIYVASRRIGLYYGKPFALTAQIRRAFLGSEDTTFGHISQTLRNGNSIDKQWLQKVAVLTTYFTVSEQIYDMVTENPNKPYLFDTENFHETM